MPFGGSLPTATRLQAIMKLTCHLLTFSECYSTAPKPQDDRRNKTPALALRLNQFGDDQSLEKYVCLAA